MADLPEPPPNSYARVDVGYDSACAIDFDRRLHCWGTIGVPPMGQFRDVSVGMDFACAVPEPQGVAVCWGALAEEPPENLLVQISCSSGHCCGVGAEGPPVCWGANLFGQLGPWPER